jgi:hypothetical protein
MYIFLSTFKPENVSEVEIKVNQSEYFDAFQTWRNTMNITDNYFFLENSLDNLRDIVDSRLLNICWDLQEFGAVKPFVHIAKEGFHTDPDKGSIKLIKYVFNSSFFKQFDYIILILGKRSCSAEYEEALKSWLKDEGSNCFYMLSDEVFAARKPIYAEISRTAENWSGDIYQELLESVANRC